MLGGARSGKSRYAESLITALPAPWIYVATAEAGDDEMAARIAAHRRAAAAGWQTIGRRTISPAALAGAGRCGGAGRLPDLWLSNLMLAEARHRRGDRAAAKARSAAGAGRAGRNEVGFGIVPDNALGPALPRSARPAQPADRGARRRVVMMVAGLPLVVKGSP